MSNSEIATPAILHQRAAAEAAGRPAPEAGGETMNRRPSDSEQDEPPQAGLEEVRTVLERNRPDAVERLLARLGDAEAGQQRGHETDDEGQHAAVQACTLIWLPIDRELTPDRALDRLLRRSGGPAGRSRGSSTNTSRSGNIEKNA